MATLTTAVNASATSWVVDALPTTHFIQVDDEIVEIEATFASIYDRRTGTTLPNKLRVLRAALGTTAASHSGGATLVPVYGAGSGGSIPDPSTGDDGDVPTVAAGEYELAPAQQQLFAQTGDDSASVLVDSSGNNPLIEIEAFEGIESSILNVGGENQWSVSDGADPAFGASATLSKSGTVKLSAEQEGVSRHVVLTPVGLQLDLNTEVMLTSGTADPSAGAGVAATEGSLYLRTTGGAGQLWAKTGAADTAWTKITP